jgi:hypothetical protein
MKGSIYTRLTLAGAFVFMTWAFRTFFPQLHAPEVLFLVCAYVDASVVLALSYFGNAPLIRDLEKINFAAVINHGVGFLLYVTNSDILIYNLIGGFLFLIQFIRLAIITQNDAASPYYYQFDMAVRRYQHLLASRLKKGAK